MKIYLSLFSLVVLLSPLCANAEDKDEVKVLAVSPDKKIEIFTRNPSKFLEEFRPHAKDRILGKGIYARFVGSDSPVCTLWSADESCTEAYVEWDSSSTRLFVTQGDEKAWDSRLFILRKDVRTGHLFFHQPVFPELLPLLLGRTKLAAKDGNSPWRFGIGEWKDPEKFVLDLHLEDEYGRIASKDYCKIMFHFASTDFHNRELTRIEYVGVLPSDFERWDELGGHDYSEKVKVLFQK